MSADLVLLGALLAFAGIGFVVGWGMGADATDRLWRIRNVESKRQLIDANRRLAVYERAALDAARHDRVRLSPTEREIVARLDEELG